MLTIQIDTSNAAFGENSMEALPEIVKIFGVIESQIACGGFEAGETLRLRDSNGNTVGEARWE